MNANQSSIHIYHVGSSFRNPVKFCDIHDIIFRYFTKFPWVTKDGKPIKVAKFRMLRTMASFRMYMQIRFMIPLQELRRVTNESYIDAKEFNFDPRCIDWEDYIMNAHIPGLEKHVIVKW
ncbi:hypothetical protein C1H46_041611 [Malus baccata]|uniref:Uncharacterized protein n=1 Tax=Malus baccata TaxID=106549 RepID=A0A540KF47_MALBA|nr:hypothetical protein C1H46_041611 [Malus baccata]